MRFTTLAATCLVFAAVIGAAHAKPDGVRDDSFLQLDFSPAGGPTLFLKCEDHTVGRNIAEWQAEDLRRCSIPSIWENTNGLQRLQSTHYSASGRVYPHDDPLLA